MIDKLKSIKKFAEQDYMSGYPERTYRETYNRLINYINLLNKPLELGMFVPCVDGVPLEKPKIIEMNCFDEGVYCYENQEEGDIYQEAEKKVLFNVVLYQNFKNLIAEKQPIKSLLYYDVDIELKEACKQLITK